MSGKLKIYACSGIGSTDEAKSPVGFWTDGTNTLSNTQAVNTILARINLLNVEVCRLKTLSKEEKIARLNSIDVLCVCLEAAKRFADNNEQLYHAGEIISVMYAQNAFNFDSTNSDKRGEHLDELIAKFNEAMEDTHEITGVNPEFMSWWQETVMERNIVGLNFGQQQNARKAIKKGIETIKGIGVVDWSKYNNGAWLENADLAELLTAGADYFLYTYFTQEQLEKLPSVFRLKARKQMQTYNYCKQLFVDNYGSEQDMQRIIQAGIIDSLEQTPDEYCAGIVEQYKTKGIGEFVFLGLVGAAAVEKLIELLSVIATLLGTIIAAICACVKDTNVAKYGAIDRAVVDTSIPDPDDYDGLNIGGGGGVDNKIPSWLPLAAIGAGLLLLLKR